MLRYNTYKILMRQQQNHDEFATINVRKVLETDMKYLCMHV